MHIMLHLKKKERKTAADTLPLNVMSVLKKRPSPPTIFWEAPLEPSLFVPFLLSTNGPTTSCTAAQRGRFSLCWLHCEGSGSCDWPKQNHVTMSASRLGSVAYYGSVELSSTWRFIRKHFIGDIMYMRFSTTNQFLFKLFDIFECR